MDSYPNQKQAIITGASSGIGKATALAFAKAGINVALVSRNTDKLNVVIQEVLNFGVQAKAYPLDLNDISVVKSKIEAIAKEFGPIDILVNNAGIAYTKLIREMPLADWQKIINLNLLSVIECTLGVLPQMRERKQGTIINIGSIAVNNPFPEWGAYAISKAALITFSQCLAAEERTNGLRVTNIVPGAVNTSLWDSETVNADLNRSAMLTPEIIAQTILQAALLPNTAVIETMTITPSLGIL